MQILYVNIQITLKKRNLQEERMEVIFNRYKAVLFTKSKNDFDLSNYCTSGI